MKKIQNIWFLLLVFSCSLSFAQEKKVKWYTIEQALALHKQNPKKIMIDVYTDWCVWCHKMDANTFNHPVIANYLNANYYPVKFDAESSQPVAFSGKTYVNENKGARSSHQFAIAILQGRMSYPSIAYLDESLQLLGAVPGYQSPKQMEVLLHFIHKDKFKTTSMEDYKKTFQSEIKQ